MKTSIPLLALATAVQAHYTLPAFQGQAEWQHGNFPLLISLLAHASTNAIPSSPSMERLLHQQLRRRRLIARHQMQRRRIHQIRPIHPLRLRRLDFDIHRQPKHLPSRPRTSIPSQGAIWQDSCQLGR